MVMVLFMVLAMVLVFVMVLVNLLMREEGRAMAQVGGDADGNEDCDGEHAGRW